MQRDPRLASALVGLLALAVAVRAGSMLQRGAWADPLAGEPTEEIRIAQALAQGLGFVSPFRLSDSPPLNPSAISPPGYPYLLAGLIRMVSPVAADPRAPFRAAMILGILIGGLAAVMTAVVAARSQGLSAFWFVGLLCAFWPTPVTESHHLWDTPVVMLTVAFGLLLATAQDVEATPGRAMAVGLALGLLTLFNPGPAPFLLVCLVLGLFVGRPFRRAVELAAIACFVWFLCLVPWQIRNQAAFGRFVPLRHGLGLELWLGNQHDADGTSRSAHARHPLDHPGERALVNALGDDAFMQRKEREARALIGSDRRRFAELTVRRITLFWLGDLSRPTWYAGMRFPLIAGVNVLKLSANLALLACALGGYLLWRSRPGRLAALSGLLLLPLPYYPTHVDPHYRVCVDLILCLLAGILAASVLPRLVTRFRRA
jgi:hypothetical protein